ncbi:MAG: ester cyclase [Rhodobacter sp.]|nr:ester cyclase [Rhodobacter sp.]
MSDIHASNKALIAPLRAAMRDFSEPGVLSALESVITEDAVCRIVGGKVVKIQALWDIPETMQAGAWPMAPSLGRECHVPVPATHDSSIGIAPTGQMITNCALDVWRIENGPIRENWAMVDLLDAFRQLCVDVCQRLQEFTKARNLGPVPIPVDDFRCGSPWAKEPPRHGTA